MSARPTKVVVIGCPGREDITRATCEALMGKGGGSTLPAGSMILVWHGEQTNPPPSPMPGWDVAWIVGKPQGHRRDLWDALIYAGDCDLIAIEDDATPCTNVIPYMVQWDCPFLTTFWDGRGWEPGAHMIDGTGFFGTQAIKIPRDILVRLQAENPDAHVPPKNIGPHLGDIVMGEMLRKWGLPVIQHRPLFDHAGAGKSICNPKAKADGLRVTKGWVGADFDAMTLLADSPPDAP